MVLQFMPIKGMICHCKLMLYGIAMKLQPPAPQPEAGGFISNPAETYAPVGFAGFGAAPPPPELMILRACT